MTIMRGDTVYVVRDASGEYVRNEDGTKRTTASSEAYEFATAEEARAAFTRSTDRARVRCAQSDH